MRLILRVFFLPRAFVNQNLFPLRIQTIVFYTVSSQDLQYSSCYLSFSKDFLPIRTFYQYCGMSTICDIE